MENEASSDTSPQPEKTESVDRRLFLKSLGKWSSAAVVAAVAGGFWIACTPVAVGGWLNRRGAVRGGWINGGGWVNRGGGWINGRGGGGWINRRGGGGGWINRW
jgi:hypothetical protein